MGKEGHIVPNPLKLCSSTPAEYDFQLQQICVSADWLVQTGSHIGRTVGEFHLANMGAYRALWMKGHLLSSDEFRVSNILDQNASIFAG